ncbi:hypothetical protein NBRC116588_09440 [Pyruvatibacter sp. HU-CL02332]|uniref:hypothetical protein n=1 Tax=Pyruvatibacter sp. HU-CL02332 TaxID=3127650 RepID=UPI003102E7FD
MNRLGRLAGTAVIASLLATPASACGGAVMLAMLFNIFPEAEGVLQAEIAETEKGFLHGERWTPETGQLQHEWRADKTSVTVAALDERLASLSTGPHIDGSAHILLIHEFRWLELTASTGGPSADLRGISLEGEGPRFFTTRYVIDNLLAGTLTWDDALGRGLIRSAAPMEEQAPWLGVLHAALAQTPRS